MRRPVVLPRVSARAVALVHRTAFGEPVPKRWKVKWVGYMRNALGLCCYGERTIKLSFGDMRNGAHRRSGMSVLEVLIHEFVHVRCPKLRHGHEFDRIVVAACHEIGLTPRGHGFRWPREKSVRKKSTGDAENTEKELDEVAKVA